MYGFFLQDIKRSFCNKGFVIGLLVLSGLLLKAACLDSPIDGSRSSYYVMANAFAASGFSPFAAVFPALAYASDFCEEYQSGYLRMVFSRMKPERYGRVRILSVALSGGVMMAIPIGLVCIIALQCGIPGVPKGSDEGMLDKMVMLTYIEKYGDWSVAAGKVILGFLFGCVWALVGLAFAVWIPNRYVALIAPFVLYESMWIGFNEIPLLNPIRLLRGDDLNSYPLSMAMECVYLALAALIVIVGIKRRYQNG